MPNHLPLILDLLAGAANRTVEELDLGVFEIQKLNDQVLSSVQFCT